MSDSETEHTFLGCTRLLAADLSESFLKRAGIESNSRISVNPTGGRILCDLDHQRSDSWNPYALYERLIELAATIHFRSKGHDLVVASAPDLVRAGTELCQLLPSAKACGRSFVIEQVERCITELDGVVGTARAVLDTPTPQATRGQLADLRELVELRR